MRSVRWVLPSAGCGQAHPGLSIRFIIITVQRLDKQGLAEEALPSQARVANLLEALAPENPLLSLSTLQVRLHPCGTGTRFTVVKRLTMLRATIAVPP